MHHCRRLIDNGHPRDFLLRDSKGPLGSNLSVDLEALINLASKINKKLSEHQRPPSSWRYVQCTPGCTSLRTLFLVYHPRKRQNQVKSSPQQQFLVCCCRWMICRARLTLIRLLAAYKKVEDKRRQGKLVYCHCHKGWIQSKDLPLRTDSRNFSLRLTIHFLCQKSSFCSKIRTF